MRCRYCNSKIDADEVYCSNCGKEVRIVPDYNPMDDVLEAQLKGALEGKEQTGTLEMDMIKRAREMKKADILKKRAKKKKKRHIIIGSMVTALALMIVTFVLIYQNSYSGIIGKGDKAHAAGNYKQAETFYKRAILKKPKAIKAYDALAKSYEAQGLKEEAEGLYLEAIEQNEEVIKLYESLIQFYLSNGEEPKITELLTEAPDNIREKMSSYIVEVPKFSLDNSKIYDSVQQLTLDANDLTICYTLDGSDPVENGIEYTEPIQLNNEGETVVTCIALNEDNIPSIAVNKTYTITFPVLDAPVISPSTGQYESGEAIEIKVPDGFKAYYTMDKSEPDITSELYEGAVVMPEGNTIFKAVLIDKNGRSSAVTIRNYIVEP